MSRPIPFPQIGVSVEEGTVLVWHVREGDTVVADQVVCEISTDKVDTEVAAPAGGTVLQIVVPAGQTAAVGAPLAFIGVTGESPGDATPPQGVDYAAEAEAAVPADGHVAWSPVARRVARENAIDPATVVGTGRRGRVRKADVLARLADGPAAPAPAPAAGAVPRGYEDVPVEVVPTSPVRRAIAEHMSRSRRTAAHMTTEVEVDMHQVTRVRSELNSERLAGDGRKLSFLPFIVRAACSALADFPDLNATFDGERLLRWREVNMGIAVDTDRGLLAPVIRGCQAMTVGTIGDRIADLAARGRERTLSADDLRAGTFTTSNPGSVGAVSAPAIINQPQVAILGVPAIVKRPTVIAGQDGDDVVAIRPIMALALTFDHRAVDGAEATRCAVAIKQRLEHWDAAAYR